MHKEKYLDGVRGVAALIVVVFHYFSAFYPALYTGSIENIRTHNGIELFIIRSPLNLLYDGSVSVSIFFVLSAYVLSYRFFREKDYYLLASSAIRRYFRLMPPVAFSVFAAYLLMKFGLMYNMTAAQLTTSEWLKSFYSFPCNFLSMLKQGVWGVLFKQSNTYNPTLWTMYYEFIGSILLFGFLALFGKAKNRWLFYMIAIMLTFQTYLLPFALGLLISDIHNSTGFKYNRVLGIIFFVLGLYLASYPPIVPVNGTIYSFLATSSIKNTSFFYQTIGTSLIIFVIINSEVLKKILSMRIFGFLGSISFSVYIMHFLVLNSLSCYLFIILSPHFRYYQAFILVFILSLSIIISCSYFVYRYIDLSGIKFSKFLDKMLFQNRNSRP